MSWCSWGAAGDNGGSLKLKKKDAVGTVGGPLAENGCGEYGRERQQRRGKCVGHSRICGARLGNRVESRLQDQEEGRENQEEKLGHLSKGAYYPVAASSSVFHWECWRESGALYFLVLFLLEALGGNREVKRFRLAS